MEANFDGLVGPTHNYAGLAQGNLASAKNRLQPSNPRLAALQGLDKMARLASLGLPQGVIPPLQRPDLDWLRRIGFTGKDTQVLDKASRQAPHLLAAAYSASSMWTANAATITPSADSADSKVHITPANLTSQLHRSLEPPQTAILLRLIFPGKAFIHHDPLPPGRYFADEGAANHTRLASDHETPGLHLFAYGFDPSAPKPSVSSNFAAPRSTATSTFPTHFLPRQSRTASEAIARLHGLDPSRTVFTLQNPAAVDAGVFHNDVIAVGNGPVLFCHESAFADSARTHRAIRRAYATLKRGPLHLIEVRNLDVTLEDAVTTYLFNSQLLTLPGDSGMLLIAADECRRNPRTLRYLKRLAAEDPHIHAIEFADLRQSMRNGGGPACLRLSVPLTSGEWGQVHPGIRFNPALHRRLAAWAAKHYRDRLHPRDLADPQLLKEILRALDALSRILHLGSIYPFQQ